VTSHDQDREPLARVVTGITFAAVRKRSAIRFKSQIRTKRS
jgi:hypothetical protein